jgi:hypothetical protein
LRKNFSAFSRQKLYVLVTAFGVLFFNCYFIHFSLDSPQRGIEAMLDVDGGM